MRAWLAIVVPLWLVLLACCAWEPIVHDSWGHVHWHHTIGLHRLDEFVRAQYAHNNPRFGQVISLLQLAPGPWHVIFTPLLELAVFWLITALALGRVPSLYERDDAFAFLVVTAMAIATMPVIGQMLFYRPYSGNYVIPWGVNLLLLLPYRLHRALPRAHGWPFAILMLAGGVIAGLCNEHTGIAVALLMIVAIGKRPTPWMIAGLVGLLVGYYLLLTAPAQHIRYNGLGDQASVVDTILARGIGGNARIIGLVLLHLAPAIPWLVAAKLQPRAGDARVTLVAVAAAAVATATMLASPKQGERLLFASTTLATIGMAAWVLPRLRGPAVRRFAAGYAIALLAVVSGFCLATYYVAGAANARRVELITTSAPGAHVVVPRLPDVSYWTIGEDLDDPARRAQIAKDWGLGGIELE